MKRILLGIVVIWLIVPVNAWALPKEVEDSLPPEAQELLEELDEDTAQQDTWQRGVSLLWRQAGQFLSSNLRHYLSGMVLLLGAVLLCGIVEDCYQATDTSTVPNYVPIAGVLTVTAATAGNMQSVIRLSEETIGQMDVLCETILPTLAAAVTASGGMISAGVRQVATVWFSDMLMALIHRLLLPLVYFYIAAAAADAMFPGQHLSVICEAIRKGITWVLTGALVLFTGYLTVSGAAAGSADRLTAQLTRSAISTAVPVVGGIISDATGSVLAGASMLRNSLGIFGMLGVLAVCLVPFLTLAVQYLLYKLTAFFAGTMGGATAGYIGALGSAFGLVLGMTGSCALLLLISICSSISVVIV